MALKSIFRGALYGLRKQTPEPVFGIIKSVMGFRQFLLRGLDCVRGEWSLVTMAWNIKRMHQPRLSAFDAGLDRGPVSRHLQPAAIRNRSDDFRQT